MAFATIKQFRFAPGNPKTYTVNTGVMTPGDISVSITLSRDQADEVGGEPHSVAPKLNAQPGTSPGRNLGEELENKQASTGVRNNKEPPPIMVGW